MFQSLLFPLFSFARAQAAYHDALVRLYMPFIDAQWVFKYRPVEIAGIPNIAGW